MSNNESPESKAFQRLVEKRLENVTDPVERYTIIFNMLQGNLILLKEQNEELVKMLKELLPLNKKDDL